MEKQSSQEQQRLEREAIAARIRAQMASKNPEIQADLEKDRQAKEDAQRRKKGHGPSAG